MSHDEHLISMAGGDGDQVDQLAAIEARIRACRTYNFGMWNADKLAHDDAPYLLALVREQDAKLEKVAALAEEWRYKGEFGWGAWQEGHGPDPEGSALDHASGEIRAALTVTEGEG